MNAWQYFMRSNNTEEHNILKKENEKNYSIEMHFVIKFYVTDIISILTSFFLGFFSNYTAFIFVFVAFLTLKF